MIVRCSGEEALGFLRLLPRRDLGQLRENTCWQQITMIAPRFEKTILLTEVSLLFEIYLDYILKSSDKDMTEVEKQLSRLEEMLHLEGKLRLVYRPIVERSIGGEGKAEIEQTLQELRQLRQETQGKPTRPRKKKRRKQACPATTR